VFAALFLVPPFIAGSADHPAIALFDAFYRSSALVFGGGHVVLPPCTARSGRPPS
jgi:chromate transporter